MKAKKVVFLYIDAKYTSYYSEEKKQYLNINKPAMFNT